LLHDARTQIGRGKVCHHRVVCADPRCREAGHDDHEVGSDGSWCCSSEACCCAPACEGYEDRDPCVCERTVEARAVVERIDGVLADLDPAQRGAAPPKLGLAPADPATPTAAAKGD
jgi:hypothetical protein